MSASVTQIWRHPIKAHGREALDRVTLTAHHCLPFDRAWAVAHENSAADGSEWARCGNFSRGAKAPQLMAISAELNEAAGTITLHHPDRPDLTIDPDRDGDAFLDWVRPLMPEDRAQSARLVRAQARGMTDAPFPSITLCNMASHRAVEAQIGQPLSIHRWRGNIWLDGLAPWQEFDWVGRQVKIGSAILTVRERTGRCAATTANPETGQRDADTLGALRHWGHTDFSVQAEVTTGGEIALDDEVTLL
ncbi:MOSC domain-containing protein [Alloyangia pacifica]|uniref:MOSC domain-containing protein n=1 Tax=Alloyangia pacifica TaxID=311180 RepID=UPI001CD74D5A|nr:MOSC N-terminal beta barrel domain-containing protein [Alloyangia pacifica]MCA0997829.1 MOSC N-terminal beta barrel domain-containing protein [Alloyangia pacifica]